MSERLIVVPNIVGDPRWFVPPAEVTQFHGWKEIRHRSYSNTLRGEPYKNYRAEFHDVFSWAIPTQDGIDTIAALGPIVEMGAGLGLWSMLLQRAGVDVIAYDAEPDENPWVPKEAASWFDVQRGTPEVLAQHSDRALFLCWPPMNDMAIDCLRFWRGDKIAYVGEDDGGCCASGDFFEVMREHFVVVDEWPVPQWYGIRDFGMIYERVSDWSAIL